MIQADIGDNAIKPGVETAFEAEAMQVAVDLQEGFLIDVAGVFGALHQAQGKAQDVAVVSTHKLLKRKAAARLSFLDKSALFKMHQPCPPCHHRPTTAGLAA